VHVQAVARGFLVRQWLSTKGVAIKGPAMKSADKDILKCRVEIDCHSRLKAARLRLIERLYMVFRDLLQNITTNIEIWEEICIAALHNFT
jgi:hypothetical protein